ncbi:hypothetical protein STEG23_028995 [Scotinomys teguina]
MLGVLRMTEKKKKSEINELHTGDGFGIVTVNSIVHAGELYSPYYNNNNDKNNNNDNNNNQITATFCAPSVCSVCGGWKMTLDSLELELQRGVILCVVLGIKPGSSGKRIQSLL